MFVCIRRSFSGTVEMQKFAMKIGCYRKCLNCSNVDRGNALWSYIKQYFGQGGVILLMRDVTLRPRLWAKSFCSRN